MADGEKSYSAGDLNLSIKATSSDALKSLDAVISRLSTIENKFSTISKSSFDGTKNGASSGSSSNKKGISKLTYEIDAFGKKYVSTMSRVTADGKTIVTQFDKYGKTIGRTTSEVDKLGRTITTVFKKGNGVSLTNGIFNAMKFATTIHLARRLGGAVANIAKYGADFTETLNLWRVAMGNDLIPQATKFVDKMNEAYGISKQIVMNAQATFKNMLGSLGNITEQQAYMLSESITQMAVDYASLYNQTFEQAFNKFEAVLAGQVRPIRHASGFDITERTLFDLYQGLGGEKSMRQLNRTEKQLLAILAIYQQMQKSGAEGDLARTINSFANQSRVAKDQMRDILSYSGAILTHWLETSGVMAKFVGTLTFVADVLEEVVNATGANKSGVTDLLGDIEKGAYSANQEVDELQGKLLGFDKFRSLDDSENEGVALDQTLLDALSKYKSGIEGIETASDGFAQTLKDLSGLWDEDGVFNIDKWNRFIGTLKTVGFTLGIVFGVKMVQSIVNFFVTLFGWFNKTNTIVLLFAVAISLIVAAIKQFIDGNVANGLYLIAGAIAAISGALLLLGGWVPALVAIITAAVVGLTALIIGNWTAIKTFFMKLINTIASAFVGFINKLIDGVNWALGWAGVDIGSWDASPNWGGVGTFAEGGLPDKGSLFVAGEAGAEYVYNMPSGQSGVANVQQIAQATYNGTIKALNDWWGGSQARGDIPQLREANATGIYQAVTGVAKSYGEKWSKY